MASATKLETQIPTETAPADADTSVKAQFPPINIGTRSSKLAQIQARAVEDALRKAHPDRALNICPVLAQGDKDKVTPLQQLSQGENAKSLWTGELEAMLEQGEVDLIVHCLKGMQASRERVRSLGWKN
jgi:hydroxymethylbilane synthase